MWADNQILRNTERWIDEHGREREVLRHTTITRHELLEGGHSAPTTARKYTCEGHKVYEADDGWYEFGPTRTRIRPIR